MGTPIPKCYNCRKCNSTLFIRNQTIYPQTNNNLHLNEIPGNDKDSQNKNDTNILPPLELSETKVNLIESYDANNNFFYYIQKIELIQKKFRQFLHRKANKNKLNININNNYYTYDDFGDLSYLNKQKFHVKNKINKENEFNFNRFVTSHLSMENVNSNPLVRKSTVFIKNIHPNPKMSSVSDIKLKPSEKKKLVIFKNDKNQMENTDEFKEPTLLQYIYNTQASFKMTKSYPTKDKNGLFIDTTPRGCFLKKNQKFKFHGNVNMKTNKKEGFGKVLWKDNSILLSYFSNNHSNGISFYQDIPLNTEFSGYYKDNKPDGYGLYKADGLIIEGVWKENNLTGLGREYSDSDTYYQGDFVNTIKNGIGIYRWSDGTLYKGEWKENQMTGYGIILYNDNKLYIGEVKRGIMEGYGEFFWGEDGKRYFGCYEGGLKHGLGVYIMESNPLNCYLGFWEKGKMNGFGISIKKNVLKYGIWKFGRVESWIHENWNIKKYLKQSQMVYLNFLLSPEDILVEYVKKKVDF